MASAMTDLELAHRVMYPGDRVYPLAAGVSTLPVAEIGSDWCYA
jgi:hypothetical protein